MTEKKSSPSGSVSKEVDRVTVATSLLHTVLNEIGTVLQPEKYLNFLNLIEKFHWYSYINNLLILSQFPEATYLASYETWKNVALSTYNDPNWRVLRPSYKAIKVIAPWTEVKGSSRSLINAAVPVYDVSQMNELPIPETDFFDIKKVSYVDIINALSTFSPYRTTFASDEDEGLSPKVKGYCNHNRRQFVVDSRLPPRKLLSVLLHELVTANLYLSNYKNEKLRPLVVESAFYILLKHFKLETEDITFSYVGRFKNEPATDICNAFCAIQTIAHSIIEKTEEHLECIFDMTPASEEIMYQTTFDDLDFMQGSVVE